MQTPTSAPRHPDDYLRMSHRRLAALYLALQSALVGAWWLALWWQPELRRHFTITADWPDTTLLAFALPDLVVMVAGSAAAAFGLLAHRRWARPVLLLVAGGVFYAALWCLGASVMTGSGRLGASLMLASAIGTAWALRVSTE